MKQKGVALPLLLIIIVLIGGASVFLFERKGGPVQEATQKIAQAIKSGGFDFSEDTPGRKNLAKLMQGCPEKDCIPSIDNPKFESVEAGGKWLNPDDIVFSIDHKGEARAYPQRILNWHEIVNDVIGGDPLTITFCPLCGSALAFDRRVDGQVLEFGVSGKLQNNDLVMYDRQTESLWQQITGEAIVGEHLGKKLRQVSMDGMRWSQFKEEHPQGKVLSRDTGFSRDYGVYPYGSYEQDRSTLFPVEGGIDERIHPKTVVYGIEVNGSFKAYQEERIKKEGVIGDRVGNINVEIVYRNGEVRAKNLETNQDLVATRLFWFAWEAFHPETELY